MQAIGQSVQAPSITVHLTNLLKDGWRLPAPPNCPPKVSDFSLDNGCVKNLSYMISYVYLDMLII